MTWRARDRSTPSASSCRRTPSRSAAGWSFGTATGLPIRSSTCRLVDARSILWPHPLRRIRITWSPELSPQYREEGSGSVILCSSVDGTGLEFLSNGRNYDFKHLPVAVSYALPEELPQEWSGYLPADVVVFDGRVWSRMTEEQRRAFRT